MNMNNITHIANGQRLTSTLELAGIFKVPHRKFAEATEKALKELRKDAPKDSQGNRLLSCGNFHKVDKQMAFTVATGISMEVALMVVRRMDQLKGEV